MKASSSHFRDHRLVRTERRPCRSLKPLLVSRVPQRHVRRGERWVIFAVNRRENLNLAWDGPARPNLHNSYDLLHGPEVRARLLGAGCDGLGWLIDLVSIGARVRAPALSRRLSSFLFVGWLPHAKYAPWGRLRLTPGDPRCRSQFRRRTLQTGVDRRRPVEDIDWKVVSELQKHCAQAEGGISGP